MRFCSGPAGMMVCPPIFSVDRDRHATSTQRYLAVGLGEQTEIWVAGDAGSSKANQQ